MSDLLFFKDDDLIRKAKIKPWIAPREPRFQDQFKMSYTDTEPVFFTDMELSAAAGCVMYYDVECFVNYFGVVFRSDDGRAVVFEQYDGMTMDLVKLEWVLTHFCIVGYNSNSYDILMLRLALKGTSCKKLHEASCAIILTDNFRPYDFEKKYQLKRMKVDHIDLIEVAPLRGSLKLYAGRLHTRRMQDLPIHYMAVLTPQDMRDILAYCFNDIDNTELLFKDLSEQLLLRCEMSKQYGVDLRSKSDAQIAEAVISSELQKTSGMKCERTHIDSGTVFRYNVPAFVSFRSPQLRSMLEIVRNAEFIVDQNGYVDMPPEIGDLALAVGSCVYRMGIGGLHSSESTLRVLADAEHLLIDRDVVSYYPSIILNQRLYPKHLGLPFLDVYRTIVKRRIEAKNVGNKVVADSLKITINGSFGKLGSKYSVLYAPDLMIQTTITGQLCLLLLIEMIEELGIPVMSANTDGVVIRCPKSRYDELTARVAWWEALTSFETEETRYAAIYARDVNNYLALKPDGSFKVKGCYSERGSAGNSVLSKNPENLICTDAVQALIAKGTSIVETIKGCRDIRRFVTIRNVSGGARKSNTYLGKVIRWYYSTEMTGEINRATKGDKIPNSDRARPLMELPTDFPLDIDYDRYIAAAMEILYDIGYYVRPSKQTHGYFGALFGHGSAEESLLYAVKTE